MPRKKRKRLRAFVSLCTIINLHRDAETQSILCINEDMREMSPDHDSLAVVDIQSGLRDLHATT